MAEAIRLSSVMGNSQQLDGGAMFGNVPRPMWSKWTEVDSVGRIPLACRALLVEVGKRKILCEAGIGDFFDPKLRERFGVQGEGHVLLENLQKLNLTPDQITDVILSHLHFDHAGGILNSYSEGRAPSLAFGNAKFYVGNEAWNRAKNPHSRDRASFIPELVGLLEQSNRLRIVSENASSHPDLPSEISFIYSSGHTPGQMHALVSSSASGGKRRKVLFAGDMIPGMPWVHLPVTMGYDRYPEMLIDEKQGILTEWARTQDFIFYTHDVKACASRVQWDGKRFSPTDPMESWENFVL